MSQCTTAYVHWDECILTVESIACRPWVHNARCDMSTLGTPSTLQNNWKHPQWAMWDSSDICTCMYILINIYIHICRTHTIGLFAFKNSHNWDFAIAVLRLRPRHRHSLTQSAPMSNTQMRSFRCQNALSKWLYSSWMNSSLQVCSMSLVYRIMSCVDKQISPSFWELFNHSDILVVLTLLIDVSPRSTKHSPIEIR